MFSQMEMTLGQTFGRIDEGDQMVPSKFIHFLDERCSRRSMTLLRSFGSEYSS